METSPSTRPESENNRGVAQTAVNRKKAATSPRAERSETDWSEATARRARTDVRVNVSIPSLREPAHPTSDGSPRLP